MLHQMVFMVTLICSTHGGYCTENHHAYPMIKDIELCWFMVGGESVPVVKQYCQYEVPGPSYSISNYPR
jgi:hypothetical protein